MRPAKIYTVDDLQAVLKRAEPKQPVQTMSPSAEKHTWRMEPLELRVWQGGLLFFPWTQDSAAEALVHEAEYQINVVRRKELTQLHALAAKYGYSVMPVLNMQLAASELETQLWVPPANAI